MSFAIEHGLFKLQVTDYHAILGVSLNEDPKQIRLRYLRIVQKLHPDICKSNKQLANEILSKLVNPAYEKLSRQNSYAEHQIVLTQIGKLLIEKRDKITLANQFELDLTQAGDKFEAIYSRHLQELAAKQYESLERVTEKIALLSELNLVYLIHKCERGLSREKHIAKASSKPKSNTSSRVAKPQAASPQSPPEPKPESIIDSYLRRAQKYLERGSVIEAIAEMREALKIDPKHSTVHALLGKAYLQEQQLTMAKVHINKAYQANPKDPIAVANKKELDKLIKSQNQSKTSKKSDSSGNSGFFSGLFGSKKK